MTQTHEQKAPVALIIFNRPEHTKKVFAAIRVAQPSQLFVIADGPRNAEEHLLCDETRRITEQIDWPCEVKRNYAEINMGCDPRVSSGISWVFEHVDRAIILEDDCVPSGDFFRFCDELLEYYKVDKRIMHITGDNYHHNDAAFSCPDSYYFSHIPFIHGWATWKRAWDLYDNELLKWPEVKQGSLMQEVFPDHAVRRHWTFKFNEFYAKNIVAWDGRWAFACIVNHGLSANPCVNLVTNVGYGRNATHTVSEDREQANVQTQPLQWPLRHPAQTVPNEKAEKYVYRKVFGINRTFKQKIITFLTFHAPGFYALMIKLRRRFL